MSAYYSGTIAEEVLSVEEVSELTANVPCEVATSCIVVWALFPFEPGAVEIVAEPPTFFFLLPVPCFSHVLT